jgi:hypothetical protein
VEEPADERKRDDFATAGRLDGARVRGLHPRYSSAASCHADFLATTILVCLKGDPRGKEVVFGSG